MTPIDLKRAREVADRIEAYGTIGPRGVERPKAASLIRSLCEKVEQLEAALAAAGKEKDAPKCPHCEGHGFISAPHHGYSVQCEWCSGTGKEKA